MRNRLIMVTGSSFGVGKSTVSQVLCLRLAALGIRGRWLSEDELLEMEVFARFNRDIQAPHLLDGARTLCRETHARGDTLILDALLPGYFWLFGRYPPAYVEAYGADLWRILLPLHPLIVYLRGDIALIFDRAVAQRGTAWAEKIVAAVKGWPLPHYPNEPVQDRADLIRFFDWIDRQSLSLVGRRPGDTVILDAICAGSEDLAQALLYHLELPNDASSSG
jgi:hypothetical protein